MTPEFAELRRLLDAATPGPWEAHEDPAGAYVTAGWAHGNTDVLRSIVEWTPRPDDALLIAAAVNALPALLDAAAERDALAAKVALVRALLRDPLSVSDWDANAYVPMVKAADILRALGGPVSTAPATSNRLDALIRALEPTRDDNDGDDVLNRCRALIASWGALDEEAQP